MGRRKKNASTDQSIKSFTEIKEDSLAVFEKEKNLLTQDIINEFEVKPVSKTSMLGGNRIDSFSGKKNYRDALIAAYEWLKQYNLTHKDSKASFVNYYPQSFVGRTILMGINIKGELIK